MLVFYFLVAERFLTLPPVHYSKCEPVEILNT